jgi:hypothetical protein
MSSVGLGMGTRIGRAGRAGWNLRAQQLNERRQLHKARRDPVGVQFFDEGNPYALASLPGPIGFFGSLTPAGVALQSWGPTLFGLG